MRNSKALRRCWRQVSITVSIVSTKRLPAALTASCSFSLDDKKVGEPLDLYNAGIIHSGPIALGVHAGLKAGQHKLTVEILGANPQAKKSYMFGIDRIDVKPAR